MAIDDLLSFWFGDPDPPGDVSDAVFARFWKKDPAFDTTLRERFGALHDRAREGALDAWSGSPRGRLALIILLDQLSRNLHRGDARSFAADTRALALAEEGIAAGELPRLTPLQRYFLLMPLMHAEDLATQDRGIALFETLLAETTDPGLRKRFASAADFARRHRDIVARFGRFPHRNGVLGRASTPEEEEFLRQPGSSF
jgi:uncharacterized protein (DUF924 family)